MQAHILSLHNTQSPDGVQRSNFLAESSHIAYQIKGNGT